ncbi:hypothetical protein [Mucilaginibacter paludis]|uniref:Tetratricopeptide repeat protein n=1 Tax=Mucilaginibacter paludis DSM 18603 TaxID=714943 RepID=H1Y346_9SPHI|nr:hypothetical protein [Mucilaginibacter paludis]EHQ28864.1 hypothetical protein Mucpa_4779 [Mucilaginibacter paludis DSM 18603]
MLRRKKIRLYLLCLFAVLFLDVAIDFACGPEPDPYDYGVSFFHNNIGGDKAYRAFYFTNGQFLYDAEEPVNEEDVNSREWADYLGGMVKAHDVKKVMYHLSHKADSILLQGYLNLKKQLPDTLKHNTFLHALKRNKDALMYYRFAKIIEPGLSYKDPWRNEPVDTSFLRKNAAYAFKQAAVVKSQFLKKRYYFQAQRMYHYTGQNNEAIEVYQKYLKNTEPGYYITGLTLGLRAGEEGRIGNPAKAAYLFSKLFATFPERRVQAYENYIAIKMHGHDVTAFASNNKEKAVMYAMNGFYTHELSTRYLKKVYNIAPASPFVEILLAREINKLEGACVTPKLTDKLPYDNLNGDYYGWNDGLKKSKHINQYINELKVFCMQIANQHRCKHPEIGIVAKAYLDWMTGNNKAGIAALNQIDDAHLNTRLYDQKQLVKLLLLSQQIRKLDSISGQQLIPCLLWLDKKVAQELKTNGEPIKGMHDYGIERRLRRFTWSARDYYQKLIAPMYLSQHDTAKAALAMLKGMPTLVGDTLSCYHQNYWEDYTTINFWQNYLHSSNLRQVISYKRKRVGDPFLMVLAAGLQGISYDCLYNLLGTAYLREHNYKEAISALSKIRIHTAKEFPLASYEGPRLKSDPFAEQLKDYPKNYHTGKIGGYSKLRFAKVMYTLQLAIKRNPQKASAYYFAIATGLYNTSYYGNAWFMIAYVWSDSWSGEQHPIPFYYNQDLCKTINAERLFIKARQLSKYPEFKAKCTFWAAKCKQNRYNGADKEFFLYKFYLKHAEAYRNEITKNKYFKELRRSYPQTQFYKTAVHECSYFRDFLVSAAIKRSDGKK